MPPTQLNSEVEVDAPVAHVYRVLTDFERYHEWNPFITSISGKLAEGETLEVALSLPEGKDYVLRPRLTRVRADAELRWRGHFLHSALLAGEHFFQLSARGETKTRFVQGEIFSGLLLRFQGATLTRSLRGFVYMNQALKRRAESTFR